MLHMPIILSVADQLPISGLGSIQINRGGRPRAQVDISQLARLAGMCCTAKECALVLGVSTDTIDRRLKQAGWQGFAEYSHHHMVGARVRLRGAQWECAMSGNTSMLIWLGKQYLGQSTFPSV